MPDLMYSDELRAILQQLDTIIYYTTYEDAKNKLLSAKDRIADVLKNFEM